MSKIDPQNQGSGLVKDMVKYLPAQVVPGLVGFISIPVITRLFPPGDYGNYSLVLAAVLVLTTLMDWLTMSIIRYFPAASTEDQLPSFYGNVIKSMSASLLTIAGAFYLLYFVFGRYLESDLKSMFHVGIGVFLVSSVFNVCQYFLRSKRMVGLFSVFTIYKSVAGFGLGLAAVLLLRAGIEGLFYGTILAMVLILPLVWRKSIGPSLYLGVKMNPDLVKSMARYSAPLLVGNLAAWISSFADRSILELFRTTEEVGIYSASYNVSERSMMTMVNLFLFVTGPIAFHIWEKEGVEKSREFRTRLTRYYLIVCLPLFVGMGVLSKPIISLLTDVQYHDGHRIIPLIALGIVFLGLQHRYHAGFLFYKQTGFISFAIVSAGILNLCLNLIFIPRHGYMAAAATTVVSYVFLLVMMVVSSRRLFVWKFPGPTLLRVAAASGVMGLAVWWISRTLPAGSLVQLILSVTCGILVYFPVLFLLREFTAEELGNAGKFLRRILPPAG